MASILPWVIIVAAAVLAVVALVTLTRMLIDLVARLRTDNEH